MNSKKTGLQCLWHTYWIGGDWKLCDYKWLTGCWCESWVFEVESFGWQLVMKWRGDASQELSQLFWSPVDLIHKKFSHQEVIYWVMNPVADNDFHFSSLTTRRTRMGSPVEPMEIHERDHEKGTLVCWRNTIITGTFFQIRLLFLDW